MTTSSRTLWLPAALCMAVTSAACLYSPLTPPDETPDAGISGPMLHGIFRGMVVSYRVVDGLAVFQDDMILGPADRMEAADPESLTKRGELTAINGDTYRWPGGVVPYVIPVGFPYTGAAQAAVAHWNSKMGGAITFVPRTTQTNYVLFTTGSSCSSYIGRSGGAQPLWVASWCNDMGSVVHELGHALGAFHEHCRNDRDTYVRIFYQNIDPSLTQQFDKTGIAVGTDIGPYDFASIMHYPALADSINGLPTIETIPPGIPIGQRNGASPNDVAMMLALYGGTVPPPQPVQTAPTISPQPANFTVAAGGTATFTVGATGTAPLTYQWFRSVQNGGQILSGQTGSQLVLNSVQTSDAGSYWVQVTNPVTTVESTHVTLTVTAAPPPPPAGGLTNGVPITNLSGGVGSEQRFTFAVPSGAHNLLIHMSGTTGNADLYVGFGTPPSTVSYACGPQKVISDESCSDPYPAAGTYYILVRGTTAFSGVQLVASYVDGTGTPPPPPPPPTVQPPVIRTSPLSLTVNQGAPASFSVLAVGTAPLTYQWFKDGQPLPPPQGLTNPLVIASAQTTQAGTYWVKVTNAAGFADSQQASLTVLTTPAPPSGVLQNNVPVDGLAGATGTDILFTFNVPAGATSLSFDMSNGTGDADLYMRFNAPPNLATYDCRPYISGNRETCPKTNPPAGTYYVLVHGYAAFAGVRLTASYSTATTPPPAPIMKLTAAVNATNPNYIFVRLDWNSIPGTSYVQVYRDGVLAGTLGAFSNAALDTYLPPTFQYTYQVVAIQNGQQIAASALVTVSH